jgi:trypsin
VTQSDGEHRGVSRVVVHPDYLLTSGYDISLLQLSQSSTLAPTQVAGPGERSIWSAGTLETIVGWGATSEGGDLPDRLQAARVPITTDAYCAGAYSDFDPRTMVCAGFPQGGVDTCQGDSGGPMFGKTSTGALRVVGTTSFGEGCARPDRPGVYARVADDTLRPWIAQNTGAGVSTGTSTKTRRQRRRAARRRAAQRRAAEGRRAAASRGAPR